MKMSCSEEDEPGPSDTRDQHLKRVYFSAFGCVSEKSDRSKRWAPDFRTEPGPSASKLVSCSLSVKTCADLDSLKSNPSHVAELDLTMSVLYDLGVKQLCGFLESSDCRLKTLRLRCCNLTEINWDVLVSALHSNPSHLTELDLTGSKPQDSGVLHLCGFLGSPDCRLQTLRLRYCGISEVNCGLLGSAFESNPFHLTELDLSGNDLQDSGVKKLFGFLKNPDCRLKKLRLRTCNLSEINWDVLVSPPNSNPSHLSELDLSGNTVNDSGGKHLYNFLRSPNCRLNDLRLNTCSLSKVSCDNLISAVLSHQFAPRVVYMYNNPDTRIGRVKTSVIWSPDQTAN